MAECKYLKEGNCVLYATRCGIMLKTCIMKEGVKNEKAVPK